ncbi:MAG: cofactor-independent phosphoglycerate mutase [Candidatus Omnitrophica bacterium]|nr:cofactor-independent phosphoglycerate mutase [Candidatus Omnitrophota bacterium]MDD5430032.1 cofactor-independent phosphoglycerate mutase [Candidatus Omnitrophota bacterium]
MKYVVIVPDGAADYPIDILGGKTPLQAADTPCIDSLAKKGILGRVKTVPRGFTPSSDVANLALLGYDPEKYYTGRGPLEAANLGIELGEDDLAFRCNLITESEGKLLDYSAGHITDKEAKILIEFLNKKLARDNIEFHFGTSYRNLMVFKNSRRLNFEKMKFYAPHDIMNQDVSRYLPRGKNSEVIIDLMNKSREILRGHEINKVRIDLGEGPANMIWLWGCGPKPALPSFQSQFGVKGAVISAVDLIKGIGKITGLEVLKIEGANGYYDTNYLGKAKGALKALEANDFVFVHIEATDEAGHNQDLRMKITCLERIDKFVVATIVEALKEQDYRILIVPDHPTPIEKRTHTDEPVPFLISGKGIASGGFSFYSEMDAQGSSLYFNKGVDLLRYFFAE